MNKYHHTFFLHFHIIMVPKPLSDAGEFGFMMKAIPLERLSVIRLIVDDLFLKSSCV